MHIAILRSYKSDAEEGASIDFVANRRVSEIVELDAEYNTIKFSNMLIQQERPSFCIGGFP